MEIQSKLFNFYSLNLNDDINDDSSLSISVLSFPNRYIEDNTYVSRRTLTSETKESRDLIGQYTRVNVYWSIKPHYSLGLWSQSSTGHASIRYSQNQVGTYGTQRVWTVDAWRNFLIDNLTISKRFQSRLYNIIQNSTCCNNLS